MNTVPHNRVRQIPVSMTTDGEQKLIWSAPSVDDELAQRVAERRDLLRNRISPHLLPIERADRSNDALIVQMAHPGGDPLAELIRKGRVSSELFLTLAVQMAEALEALHNRRIAHGRLTPHAFFVSLKRRTVKLALPPDCLIRTQESPAGIDGRDVADIVYCAPEQSGRTETRPDTRADLYALGVILHEMLTGSPPFFSLDKLELLHMHQAVPAPEIGTAKDDPMGMLSRVVSRLLKKAPGNRYQTAYGLLADLRQCRETFLRDGAIGPFSLGIQDQKAAFAIPGKLYGRDAAIGTLQQSFDAIIAGDVRLLMVSGSSGSGKSALVETLRRFHAEGCDPIFLTGKYDEIQGLPYFGLVQALRDLVFEILARGDQDVARFRDALHEALGDNISVITEFLPELRHIVGEVPAQLSRDALERTQRFQVAMLAFFEALSDANTPVILFLDDLQWADAASITLLEEILLTASPSHLLVVGAYRESEVSKGQRLGMLVDIVREAGVKAAHLGTGPLAAGDVRQLIADTLHLEDDTEGDTLANVITAKTQGNAFHVRRLLIALHREGAIRFDAHFGRWHWEMRAVAERMVEADVAQLMSARLQELPRRAAKTLGLGAVFGTVFSASSITIVSDLNEAEIQEDLAEALAEGFLVRAGKNGEDHYRFSHDTVRDTAYRSIAEDARQDLHYKVGSFLLRDIDDPMADDRLFSAMDQISLGAARIVDPTVGQLVVQGAIVGARRARSVAAYGIAGGYTELVDHLPKAVSGVDWETAPDVARDLRIEAMEAAFFAGGFPLAEPHFMELTSKLTSNSDKAHVYQILVTLHTARSEYQRAIDVGVEGLKLLGVNLSGTPGPKIMTQLIGTQLDLRKHDVFDFSNLPDMEDPEAEQLIEMMMMVSTPAFLQNKDLFVLIALRMFRLTLRKGLTSAGVFSIQNYAITIYLAFKSIDKAYKIGSNLFDLLEPRGINPMVRGRFTYTYSVVVAWHFRAYEDLRELLREGLAQSWTAADLEYVGYYYYSILKYGWLMCEPLDQIADQLREYERYDRRLRHEVLSSVTRIYARAVTRLIDGADSGLWSSDDKAIEAEMTGEASLGTFYTTELLLTHVFGDWAVMGTLSNKLREQSGFATLGPEFVDFHLLLGLSLTRAPSTTTLGRKKKAQLRKHLAALKRLAEKYPTNHGFQYLLLQAEATRLAGDTDTAMRYYDNAIQKAEGVGAWSYVGIACECAADLAATLSDNSQRAALLQRAYEAYSAWGAKNKLRKLTKTYPEIAPTMPDLRVSVVQEDTLDVTSVIKASQLILEVTDLDILLKRLMLIALENAGADAGSLYLADEEGRLRLAAQGYVVGSQAEAEVRLEGGLLNDLDPTLYPREIVAQVAASQDAVILTDALSAPRHARLSYVQAQEPRSLMCLPVTGPRGLQAVLYLQNSHSEGVFTAQRQEILSTLASLAAISLANAQLYARQVEALELEKRASEELTRVNRLKDEFLATTSHELRTPLNGMIGLAEALVAGAKGDLPDAARDTLDLVVASGQRLSHLVTDILDLSRLREGELRLQEQPLDMRALVDVVFAVMEPRANNNDVTLINDVPEGERAILADEGRLQQILFNLTDNAIKFSSGGEVRISLNAENGRARVSVTDTGQGIAEEDQARIFNSFEKLDSSDESAFAGVGLGLAITKRLVEMHGGKISVTSADGQGSSFTFDLAMTDAPAQPGSTSTVSRLAADTEGEARADTSKMLLPHPVIHQPELEARRDQFKALLIDDDAINLEVLRNFMELEGFSTELAHDGPSALRILDDGYEPDIVLLDVMMPGMSGYEVCRKIRETRPAASLPVVMLTAKNQVENLRAGFEAGASDYLAKPFSRDELSARMHAHISLARLTNAYERFVPVEFLDFLESESILDIDLGNNVARHMTVMFSDIRGFTGIAERSSPSETFALLNEYFGRLGPLVKANNGVVNQFLGDGIMSLFPGNPDDGVEAAVQMLREMRGFNAQREGADKTPLVTGIGLHSGDLVMGIMGDTHRMSGNVVSDAVNLAARLEGITARYGVGIAASEDVISSLTDPDRYPHRKLDVVRVAGRENPVVVYEIYAADPEESIQLKTESRADFETALTLFRDAKFTKAQVIFEEIAALNPQDRAALRLARRADQMSRSGAPQGWDGVEDLEK